jgi:integrase
MTGRFSPLNIDITIQHANWVIDRLGLKHYTVEDVKKLRVMMAYAKMARGTQRNRLWAMEHLCRSLGLDTPVDKKRITGVTKMPQWLTTTQMRLLLDSCTGPDGNLRDAALIGTLGYAGLRSKEAAELTLDDVDFKKMVIWVRDHGTGVKNGYEESVDIADQLVPLLKDWLKARPDARHDCVFMSANGHPLSRRSILEIVQARARIAGVEGVTARSLRHTCGSAFMQAGGSLVETGRVLRHRSKASTLIYLHPDEQTVKKKMRALKY